MNTTPAAKSLQDWKSEARDLEKEEIQVGKEIQRLQSKIDQQTQKLMGIEHQRKSARLELRAALDAFTPTTRLSQIDPVTLQTSAPAPDQVASTASTAHVHRFSVGQIVNVDGYSIVFFDKGRGKYFEIKCPVCESNWNMREGKFFGGFRGMQIHVIGAHPEAKERSLRCLVQECLAKGKILSDKEARDVVNGKYKETKSRPVQFQERDVDDDLPPSAVHAAKRKRSEMDNGTKSRLAIDQRLDSNEVHASKRMEVGNSASPTFTPSVSASAPEISHLGGADNQNVGEHDNGQHMSVAQQNVLSAFTSR